LEVKALDHDFKADDLVVPIGILVVRTGELYFSVVHYPATSDAIMDALEHWWTLYQSKCPLVTKLVIDLDNGPENSSHRTQFMSRMVQFVDKIKIPIELVYYPPYHSKYNPIERCWSVLERCWNGSLLRNVATVIGFASNMTWKGINPVVTYVKTVYKKHVSLTKEAMRKVEKRLERHPVLGRWSVQIPLLT
jgi:hypothetical protein